MSHSTTVFNSKKFYPTTLNDPRLGNKVKTSAGSTKSKHLNFSYFRENLDLVQDVCILILIHNFSCQNKVLKTDKSF